VTSVRRFHHHSELQFFKTELAANHRASIRFEQSASSNLRSAIEPGEQYRRR